MENITRHYGGIAPFDMMVKYLEFNANCEENVFDSHFHEECEIYINLSGDVSFVVENKIYPVFPGSIIITRPYEYHHCVYHSNRLHKHFWILFSCAGNEDLLDVFFDRKVGEGNLLTLPSGETEVLISLCHRMTMNQPSSTAAYFDFFRLLNLLCSAESIGSADGTYPADVVFAIDYISKNFSHQISISDIAKGANVSINTLERHFCGIFNCSPSEYLRKKRLAGAAKLLSEGATVTEASEKSGFSDYSKFISLFKKTYGKTPLKYQKSRR